MHTPVVVAFLCLASKPSFAQRVAAADTALPRRVQLGATLGPVTDSMRASGTPVGAAVLGVITGSPAAAAGVAAGDVIVRIGTDTVRSVADALSALHPLIAGRNAPVVVVRNGRATTLTMVTRERPRESSPEFTVEYRAVTARGGKHRVLVTHPNDAQPHAAVLLIGGIGCYPIDVPSGESAYRDLAYHLTRRGYTTVRVEKLGMGDSDGASCIDSDFATELDGYRQALVAMKRYASVDSTRIFLFGHSIGGLEAPLLATDHGDVPHIRGIAVLSTTGIAWYEYELTNLRRQLRLQDLSPDSVEQAMRRKTTCAFEFLIAKGSRQSIVAADPLCSRYIAYPASDAYMQAVADQTPATAWKNVEAPALVMWGTSDFVTSREEHLQLTDDINAMHPGAATFADISDIDHFISHQATAKTSLEDRVVGLNRPYYGATLEPVIDGWLARFARLPRG
jgi:pimeloyl-ACP methyl ester carboxylesterase